MAAINLHSILRHLVGDNNFLSKIVPSASSKYGSNISCSTENKIIKKKKTFNMMEAIITEYIPLSPYEIQSYASFPEKIKSILSPDYVRKGIKNTTEKNLNVVNISFLNSLNMLLRPDLYPANIDEHLRNLVLLENFIVHKIHRNYKIDKAKNFRKVQLLNKELEKKLQEGKISHELIQYVSNIFEINLIVFDFVKLNIQFYWTHGTKYPYLNLFKNLHCMAYIHGNYEPIMPSNQSIPEEQIQKMYVYILNNIEEIQCIDKIELAVHSLEQLNSWNIASGSYLSIIENFYNNKTSIAEIFKKYENEIK